ncbi:MAG TPA: hypothetical protein VJ793_20255 [Anaerolineae bacterium]|nr:hypothetical protein [Anaerolineae bacterium]
MGRGVLHQHKSGILSAANVERHHLALQQGFGLSAGQGEHEIASVFREAAFSPSLLRAFSPHHPRAALRAKDYDDG